MGSLEFILGVNNMLMQNNKIEIYQGSPISGLITEIKKFIAAELSSDLEDVEVAAIDKFDFGNFTIPLYKYSRSGDYVNLVVKLKNEFLEKGIGKIELVGKYINFSFDSNITQKIIEPILSAKQFANLDTLKNKKIMVEYSSPNTNKPLHLGHVRNNVLGMAIANILSKNGAQVIKACLINDRGIHICKSMWAYQKFGKNLTPQSQGIKGDLFVGNYYVMFEQALNKEKQEYINNHNINVERLDKIGIDKLEKEFIRQSSIYAQAQDLLLRWENKDQEIMDLWKKMNHWVYQGFAQTYAKLGSKFDVEYYESETYLLGKQIVLDYLEKGITKKNEDGSVGIELNDGSFKVLLRDDGTSVYMTQDIGTTLMRSEKYHLDNTIYVVGDEQNHHFDQLFEILKKLGLNIENNLYHLSYGMVDLPEGKMKSREGNVVDADGLIDELTTMAKEKTSENNHLVAETIALAAIKYYILKSNAKTKLIFDSKKSLEFEGLTGPYLQYTCARINSIIDKVEKPKVAADYALLKEPSELEIINLIARYNEKLITSANLLDPAILTNYLGDLAIKFNQWYHRFSVANSESQHKKARLDFIEAVNKVLIDGLKLIGIEPIEKM